MNVIGPEDFGRSYNYPNDRYVRRDFTSDSFEHLENSKLKKEMDDLKRKFKKMEEEVRTMKEQNKIAVAERHPITIDFNDFDYFMSNKFAYFIRSSSSTYAPWLIDFRFAIIY